MANGLAALFGAGGTLVLITLVLPHAANTNDLGVAVPPILAYVVAVVLLVRGARVSLVAFQALLAVGAILITACVVFGGDSAGAYPLMYVWVALYAAYFFPRAVVVGQVAFCAALYAASFVIANDVPVPQAHWVMVVGTAAVAGVLVAALVSRMRAQAADLGVVAELASGLGDLSDHATEVCERLCASTGGELVALMDSGPDGEGLRILAHVGEREALDGVRELETALAECSDEVRPVRLCAHSRSRLHGPVIGLAHPVLRDGAPAALLLVTWRRPCRRPSDRVEGAVAVFAGQAGVTMERVARLSRERERRALEINDNILQGLAVAKYALAAGAEAQAVEAIDETLAGARRLITEQLDEVVRSGHDIRPGDLVRRTTGDLRGSQ